LLELLARTPLEAGTSFVLDRGPDFFALLRLRGEHRTFLALDQAGVVGTVSAVWHDVEDAGRTVRIGEVADLRVARRARGGRAVAYLLDAVAGVFRDFQVDWVTCVIGDRNVAARALTEGKAGLPPLDPLTRYASVHLVAWAIPLADQGRGLEIRTAGPRDGEILSSLIGMAALRRQFVPRPFVTWPEPGGHHQAWLAFIDGVPAGALLAWDPDSLRRIRVVRYREVDLPLRALVATAAALGLAAPLPGPGGVLRLLAIRWLSAPGRPDVAAALVRSAMRAAARDGKNVLQVNLDQDDPARRALPASPRSTYWSTTYGRPIRDWSAGLSGVPVRPSVVHTDLALV
jgi:hypothetical protein